MTTIESNKALISLQISNAYNLASPFLKEHVALVDSIKQVLTDGNNILHEFTRLYPSVFALRLKGIAIVSDNKSIDYTTLFTTVYEQTHELGINKSLEVLVENTLFALKCNKEFKDSLPVKKSPTPDQLKLTYDDFLLSINSQNTIELAEKIITLIHLTLSIELVLFSLHIIDDAPTIVSEKTIDELASIVADAGQSLSSIAMELGIIKTPYYAGQELPDLAMEYDEEYIQEQKELAELGIADFALLFENK